MDADIKKDLWLYCELSEPFPELQHIRTLVEPLSLLNMGEYFGSERDIGG